MMCAKFCENRTKTVAVYELSVQQAMSRDEGSYQLSHAYDRFLDTAPSRCVKNRKNWVPASSDEGLW